MSGGVQGTRILVVEDDFVVRLEIETVLGAAGASVRGCATVVQALTAISAETFDAAVLDVRLGSGTVEPVARKLSELCTPFVFYTGTEETAISQWPQARVIAKPAASALLVRAVIETLGLTQRPAR
jgi:DNA-binding NtrC family response regulator